MVSAAGGTVTNSYIFGHILSVFIVNVPGELVRRLAGRTGVAVGFGFIFLQVITEGGHFW